MDGYLKAISSISDPISPKILEKMSLSQKKQYLEAAEKVYDGLSTMAKIRHLT